VKNRVWAETGEISGTDSSTPSEMLSIPSNGRLYG
jgi:hypothetical protein